MGADTICTSDFSPLETARLLSVLPWCRALHGECIPEVLRAVSPWKRNRLWLFMNPHTVLLHLRPDQEIPEFLLELKRAGGRFMRKTRQSAADARADRARKVAAKRKSGCKPTFHRWVALP